MAFEIVPNLLARSPVLTWARLAPLDNFFASLTRVTVLAVAFESVSQVYACGAMTTGHFVTE